MWAVAFPCLPPTAIAYPYYLITAEERFMSLYFLWFIIIHTNVALTVSPLLTTSGGCSTTSPKLLPSPAESSTTGRMRDIVRPLLSAGSGPGSTVPPWNVYGTRLKNLSIVYFWPKIVIVKKSWSWSGITSMATVVNWANLFRNMSSVCGP